MLDRTVFQQQISARLHTRIVVLNIARVHRQITHIDQPLRIVFDRHIFEPARAVRFNVKPSLSASNNTS
jgi:hypothetical protein